MDLISYALAKKYVDKTMLGGGAVVGKNVTISSIVPITGGNRVTFSYTLDDGTVKTSAMDVMDGVDGKDGLNGDDGVGISKIEKIKTVGLIDTYRMTFDDDSTFDYDIHNGGGSSTDEKVKLSSAATDAKYLNELIDNSTIKVDTDNNCLVAKKIDGQTVTVAEINFLTGVTANVQEQINNLGKSMTMYGVFGTKADLLASVSPTPVDGNTAIVIADEDNNNKQMTYIYIASNSAWTQVAESSVTVRDFTTNPINLDTETTGILSKDKIDTAIARLADVLDKATYVGSADGIVKQADTLTGLTYTITALNNAIKDSHTHTNKTVLDKIISNGLGSSFLADNGEYISILSIGTSEPIYTSQIWIDNTDTSKPKLKIYDGTDWIVVSGGGGSGGSITIDNALSDTSENPVQNKVVNAALNEKASKDTMTGATSSSAGTSGLVPAPASGKQGAYLRGDGTWAVPTNTDTKVTNTLNTTVKAYVTGTTSSSTNTGTQVFDTGVYLDTTAGMLTATTFKGELSGNASTSNKLKSTSYTTITINTSDWTTNSDGGYMCTKTLDSAMPYENFNFDVVLSADQAAAKLQIEAWSCVIADGRIAQTTSNGSTTAFTFYAFTTQPSVALTVAVQGVS